MSRYLLEDEFKKIAGSGSRQSFSVFFLLDDYADWLAQKESRIADILGLCVEEREDGPHLHVAVVESKYVSASSSADAKRSSKAQLLATLTTFRDALFGDPGRLDRDVWLSRLADLLIDADIPPGCSGLLERARAKLREGEAGISLRGYSQVFIHSADTNASSTASEQILLDDSDGIQAWQEVFDRPELRGLVEAYVLVEEHLEDVGLRGEPRTIAEQVDDGDVLDEFDVQRVGCLGFGALDGFDGLSPAVAIGRRQDCGLQIGSQVPLCPPCRVSRSRPAKRLRAACSHHQPLHHSDHE